MRKQLEETLAALSIAVSASAVHLGRIRTQRMIRPPNPDPCANRSSSCEKAIPIVLDETIVTPLQESLALPWTAG